MSEYSTSCWMQTLILIRCKAGTQNAPRRSDDEMFSDGFRQLRAPCSKQLKSLPCFCIIQPFLPEFQLTRHICLTMPSTAFSVSASSKPPSATLCSPLLTRAACCFPKHQRSRYSTPQQMWHRGEGGGGVHLQTNKQTVASIHTWPIWTLSYSSASCSIRRPTSSSHCYAKEQPKRFWCALRVCINLHQ